MCLVVSCAIGNGLLDHSYRFIERTRASLIEHGAYQMLDDEHAANTNHQDSIHQLAP